MKAQAPLLAALLMLAAGPALAAGAAGESGPPATGAAARPGAGPVMVLKLHDEEMGGAISNWSVVAIKRALERARAEKAVLVLVEVTTNGGRVDIVQRMSEALTDAKGTRVVAYVRDRAMSAGALVALSCDEIYMKEASQIGAATPIMISPVGGVQGLPPEVKEKFLRFLTTTFRTTAEKKGHNGALAAAMVDPAIEVVAVRDGEKVVPMTREEFEEAKKKKGGRRLFEEGIIVKKDKILIFNTKQAVKWGLAEASVADRAGVLAREGLAGRAVLELSPTWADKLARFCSSGIVIALLIAIAILSLYVELHKPTGLGAGLFLTALAAFFWASFLAGTAGPVSIILFLLGFALLLVEIFFIPGFGVAGISGIVLMIVGMISARIPPGFFGPRDFDMPLRWGDLSYALYPMLIGFVLGSGGVAALMRFFPSMPLLNKLVLRADMGGAVVSAAQAAGVADAGQLVGLTGVAATKLRPGGSARFGDKFLDVVSDGDFIDAGTAVKIVAVSGNRIVVRRA